MSLFDTRKEEKKPKGFFATLFDIADSASKIETTKKDDNSRRRREIKEEAYFRGFTDEEAYQVINGDTTFEELEKKRKHEL